MAAKNTGNAAPANRRDFWVLLACLGVILGSLFYKSFLPQYVLHNNDNPVGSNAAEPVRLPEAFKGVWAPNWSWLGLESSAAPPDLTMTALWLGGPVNYAKFAAPSSLLFLGLCAWLFCRSLKLSTFAAVLTGLAAALHGDYFSNACWGQVSRPMALGTMFLALSAIHGGTGWRAWVRVALGGMAVGWGIMEGFDIAALFSVVVGVYVVFHAWATGTGPAVKTMATGGLRLAILVVFAVLLAVQALTGLFGAFVKDISGMAQDEQTKQEQWNWATQWSFRKTEMISNFIPGVFGYRMDTPDGGQYWGAGGRDAVWDEYLASDKKGPPPQGFLRHSGAGVYGGLVVPVVAIWALLQSFRRRNSPYSDGQRKLIWFWAGLAFGCVLLSWGRFAPFYKFFYMLPYASTIRSPGKFFHIVDWSMLVMFAFGIHGLSQRALKQVNGTLRGLLDQWKSWRASAELFDRRWLTGSKVAMVLALVGWGIYAAASADLKRHLGVVQFDPDTAAAIASFSIRQVGWFVLFLLLTLVVVLLMLCGYFAGPRAKTGFILLGAVLVTDLGRANLPWIVYWDFPLKYATNPIIERLRPKAYEQRVTILPQWIPDAFRLSEQVKGAAQYLNQIYRVEWMQHHFLWNNIHCLDVIQLPRQPVDYVAFETAMQVRSGDTLHLATRRWELTSTRYLFAMAGFEDLLNKQFDPKRAGFRVAERFNIVPKPGYPQPRKLEELTAEPSTNGMFALIEFTGALSKAKLYTKWQVSTNDEVTLQTLANPAFDPTQTVLISVEDVAAPVATTNQTAGTVEIKSYAPTRVVLEASTETPAVLLLNDRYAPQWQVKVNGKPETLLRCNYLMRGVKLSSGSNTVEFAYLPSKTSLHISLTTMALGACLLGLLLTCGREKSPVVAAGNFPTLK